MNSLYTCVSTGHFVHVPRRDASVIGTLAQFRQSGAQSYARVIMWNISLMLQMGVSKKKVLRPQNSWLISWKIPIENMDDN